MENRKKGSTGSYVPFIRRAQKAFCSKVSRFPFDQLPCFILLDGEMQAKISLDTNLLHWKKVIAQPYKPLKMYA